MDEESVNEVAEVVAVSEDGSQTANATDAVLDNWMPVPTDSNGRPFAVVVRPVEHCSRWKFSRVFFEIAGADMFRIRVGNTYVTDWVSIRFIYWVSRQKSPSRFAVGISAMIGISIVSLAEYSYICIPHVYS